MRPTTGVSRFAGGNALELVWSRSKCRRRNPAKSVSKIEVGISLLGALGLWLSASGTRKGGFYVASFPEGTIALACVAVSGGKDDYGDATLAHTGPRSVTLVLRNVEDLKNGVAPLRRSVPRRRDFDRLERRQLFGGNE